MPRTDAQKKEAQATAQRAGEYDALHVALNPFRTKNTEITVCPEMRELFIANRCVVCNAKPKPGEKLKRCGGCITVPYCSQGVLSKIHLGTRRPF